LDWSLIDMNESNTASRFLLTVLTKLRNIVQLAHKRCAPETLAGSCAWFCCRAQRQMMDCFYCLSFWLFFPMVIWLSSGWIGLLGYCQALAGIACLLEKAIPNPELRAALAGNKLSEGELSCCLVKSEAG
jgi:hypothetical protein